MTSQRSTRSFAFVLLVSGVAIRGAGAASFEGLGDVPGGDFRSEPHGVADCGVAVVGESDSSIAGEAFRWTQADGMVSLPGADSWNSIVAHAVSADGAIAVGVGYPSISSIDVRSRILSGAPDSIHGSNE